MENFALNQLAQLVYDYCGLNYFINLASLEMKVSKRLQELNLSLWSYINFLERNTTEWDTLVEILTINETYFFREDKQFNVLQNEILAQSEKSREKPFKIWSAACSTGEEPYSLAMTILDTKLTSTTNIKIVGTDINKKVLQTAENGIYGKRSLSFRRIPTQWLETYFTDGADEYRVKPAIKDMVSFKYLNLLDEETMSLEHEYDIIFCRNVLIYFDSETVKKVASSFYRSLKKGGLLFLGHAESISNMGIGFETISMNGTFYYRKG